MTAVRVLFGPDQKSEPLPAMVRQLRAAQQTLQTISVNELLAAWAQLGEQLTDSQHPIHEQFPQSGLAFVAEYCRPVRLRSELKTKPKHT